MRDIRPSSVSRRSKGEERELYEASAAIKRSARGLAAQERDKRPQLTGQSVPVTNIHLPRPPAMSHSDADHEAERQPPRAARVRVGSSDRTVLLAFFGLVILAGALAAWLFLPTAEVVLHLRTAPLLVDQELKLGSGADEQLIPGTVFWREVAVNGSVKVEHTKTIGNKATGSVAVINRSGSEQKIKERSRLASADGTILFMLQPAFVPPQGRVSVAVEAAEPGAEGNLESGRLEFMALDEASRRILYAEVTEPLSGGSGEIISVVSEEDRERARQVAGEHARTQVEAEIRGELPDGWALLEESWSGELASLETSPEVGEASPELGYSARVTVRVMGFEQQKLLDQLRRALEERLDNEYMLFPGAIAYAKSVRDIDWDAAAANLSVRVTHTTIPRLNLDTLREKLASRSAAEAQSYLEGLPGVRSAEISLWPFWVQSVPRIEKRISLQLEPERAP